MIQSQQVPASPYKEKTKPCISMSLLLRQMFCARTQHTKQQQNSSVLQCRTTLRIYVCTALSNGERSVALAIATASGTFLSFLFFFAPQASETLDAREACAIAQSKPILLHCVCSENTLRHLPLHVRTPQNWSASHCQPTKLAKTKPRVVILPLSFLLRRLPPHV